MSYINDSIYLMRNNKFHIYIFMYVSLVTQNLLEVIRPCLPYESNRKNPVEFIQAVQ